MVLLTGTGPWQYSYGNDLGAINRYAGVNPDTVLITSKEPSVYFRLLSVSNGCGAGAISEPSVIRVEIVLATEESGTSGENITFGPNPSDGRIVLHFKTGSKRDLNLYNANGVLMWTKTVFEQDPEIDMRRYPSGSYLMKITHSDEVQTLRIIKE